jgi:hypothetical protein
MKAEGEEALYSAMQRISDRLPDLQLYKRIYPDAQLGSMLAETYKDIIIFARTASAYFQSGSFCKFSPKPDHLLFCHPYPYVSYL